MQVCFECDGVATHNHHVVPKSRGGTKTVLLCDVCHSKAHHRNKNMNTSKLTKEALQRKKNKGERAGAIPYGFSLASDGVHLVSNFFEKDVIKKCEICESQETH